MVGEDLIAIIKKSSNAVHSPMTLFSATTVLTLVPSATAEAAAFTTLVGAWLRPDPDLSEGQAPRALTAHTPDATPPLT